MTDIVLTRVEQEAVRDLVRRLRQMPERYDKLMRREFAAVARETRDKLRPAVAAAHPRLMPRKGARQGTFSQGERSRPTPTSPKRRGEYRWKQIVNSAVSGADSDTPYVKFGSPRLPGWAGWEFGGAKYPQFGARTPRLGRGNRGHAFFPTLLPMAKGLDPRMRAIIEKYNRMAFG